MLTISLYRIIGMFDWNKNLIVRTLGKKQSKDYIYYIYINPPKYGFLLIFK